MQYVSGKSRIGNQITNEIFKWENKNSLRNIEKYFSNDTHTQAILAMIKRL